MDTKEQYKKIIRSEITLAKIQNYKKSDELMREIIRNILNTHKEDLINLTCALSEICKEMKCEGI